MKTDAASRGPKALLEDRAYGLRHKGVCQPLVLKLVGGTELMAVPNKMNRPSHGVGEWHRRGHGSLPSP